MIRTEQRLPLSVLIAALGSSVVGGALVATYNPLVVLAAAGSLALMSCAYAFPAATTLALVALWVIFEDDLSSPLYLPGLFIPAPFGVSVAYIAAAACAVGLLVRLGQRRGREPAFPYLGVPVACLLVLVPLGIYQGFSADGLPTRVLSEGTGIVAVCVFAIASASLQVTQVALVRFCWFIVALVIVRSAASLVFLTLGSGTPLLTNEEILSTSLDGTTNWLRVLVILGLVAASTLRLISLRVAVALALLPSLALFFSYRRSFLLGLLIAAICVVVAASVLRHRSWTPALLGALGVATLLLTAPTFSVTAGATEGGQSRPSPISLLTADRAASDAYRVAERRNVLSTLRQNPIGGLGLGVPWPRTYALPSNITTAATYVHNAPMWYWLKLGLVGGLAYLALMLGAMWVAWTSARQSRTRTLQAISLTLGGGVLALFTAELTATFSGSDLRLSPVLGVVLGLNIAVASLGSPGAEHDVDNV